MNYTDEEAVKKFCPLRSGNCQGSNCMLWSDSGKRVTATGRDVTEHLPGGGGRIVKEQIVEMEGACSLTMRGELPR